MSRNNLGIVRAFALKLVPPLDSRNFLNNARLGRIDLPIIGVIITLLGLVIWSGFAPKWLGRLPGDIRIEREHYAFSIVTCIILSILVSLLLSIFRR